VCAAGRKSSRVGDLARFRGWVTASSSPAGPPGPPRGRGSRAWGWACVWWGESRAGRGIWVFSGVGYREFVSTAFTRRRVRRGRRAGQPSPRSRPRRTIHPGSAPQPDVLTCRGRPPPALAPWSAQVRVAPEPVRARRAARPATGCLLRRVGPPLSGLCMRSEGQRVPAPPGPPHSCRSFTGRSPGSRVGRSPIAQRRSRSEAEGAPLTPDAGPHTSEMGGPGALIRRQSSPCWSPRRRSPRRCPYATWPPGSPPPGGRQRRAWRR
jgi:hypothetical protein